MKTVFSCLAAAVGGSYLTMMAMGTIIGLNNMNDIRGVVAQELEQNTAHEGQKITHRFGNCIDSITIERVGGGCATYRINDARLNQTVCSVS